MTAKTRAQSAPCEAFPPNPAKVIANVKRAHIPTRRIFFFMTFSSVINGYQPG
jgi:hypothetical protein